MCFKDKSAYFRQIYTTVTNRQNLGDNFRINAYNTSQKLKTDQQYRELHLIHTGPKSPVILKRCQLLQCDQLSE